MGRMKFTKVRWPALSLKGTKHQPASHHASRQITDKEPAMGVKPQAATPATDIIDSGAPVRADERFDTEAVTQWLSGQVAGLTGTPEVTQFTGGASNWTYRLYYN